jgi:hypothetical protein
MTHQSFATRFGKNTFLIYIPISFLYASYTSVNNCMSLSNVSNNKGPKEKRKNRSYGVVYCVATNECEKRRKYVSERRVPNQKQNQNKHHRQSFKQQCKRKQPTSDLSCGRAMSQSDAVKIAAPRLNKRSLKSLEFKPSGNSNQW